MASPGGKATEQQQSEIAAIRKAFPGRCRVMSEVGSYSHVVTIQPQDMDATLKFELKASYPDTAPTVQVRSGSLTDVESQELLQTLLSEAAAMVGRPMMADLVTVAEKWLRGAGIKPGTTVSHVPVYLGSDKAKKKRRQKGKKKQREEEVEDTKLPSMKTADDVIKRILWDDGLDRDDFLVGYVDRFRGIVEKYFSAFSWEDLASVDYNVLAIPKHRIQYFKYRNVVVWDKPARLDNFFGSTGGKITIKDVMENYETFAQKQVGASGQVHAAGSGTRGGAAASSSDDSDSDDDDDDDDGIQVTIGTGTSFSSGVPTAAHNSEDMAKHAEESDKSHYNPYWTDKLRPNHFLAFRITDPKIRSAVEEVQDFILDHEPLYGECCVPAAALHVTLCTLGLDTPEQIDRASQVLQDLHTDLQERCPSQPLKIHGVSTFFQRVIYAKVKEDPALMEFVDYAKLCLRSAGIDIRDNHEFVPHMTIMKVTRPVARKKGSKNVDSWMYEGYSDMHFGSQSIDGVYLCSMGDERREDGFYVCPSEISFQA